MVARETGEEVGLTYVEVVGMVTTGVVVLLPYLMGVPDAEVMVEV